MEKRPKRLGEILIENGLLTKSQLEFALGIQKKEGGLIGEILLKHGFVSEKDIVNALIKQEEYIYVHKETPLEALKNKAWVIIVSLSLTIFLLFVSRRILFIENINNKLYGVLLDVEYSLRHPPPAINDILLVTIDNDTLSNMPYRWPYPRSDFAAAIENLKKAHPRLIAIDFAFLGKSVNPREDEALRNALNFNGKIILASSLNEQGELDFSNSPFYNAATTGIITKLQDSDEVIRRCLTYLVSQNKNEEDIGFLSWEMQVLKKAKNIDLKSFITSDSALIFMNNSGEEWVVPVEADTKSFLIRFRSRTRDFRRIGFYRILKGSFDPGMVKDKIVIIGVLSTLLQDLKHTSIGWLPGMTLNTNAFLTLYTHDFLRSAPKYAEYAVIILGVILGTFFATLLNSLKAAILLFCEILIFFLLSYILILCGYVWNYAVLPLALAVCPVLSKKIIYYCRIV
jgi:CHASE2 domain-containing sensor protein